MGQGSDLNRRSYDDSSIEYDYTAPETDRSADDTYEATTNQIEAEIEQTRAQMSETINAIQDRLSPQHLADQAKDAVYDATIGKAKGAGSNMIETIKQNPLPAAIAALSIGWLFRKSSSMNNIHPVKRAIAAMPPSAISPMSSTAMTIAIVPTPTISHRRASWIGWAMWPKTSRIRPSIWLAASRIRPSMSPAMCAIRLNTTAIKRWSRLRKPATGSSRPYTNPMAMGAVALAIGTAVGLSLPGTPVENRVMGEARESLVEKV